MSACTESGAEAIAAPAVVLSTTIGLLSKIFATAFVTFVAAPARARPAAATFAAAVAMLLFASFATGSATANISPVALCARVSAGEGVHVGGVFSDVPTFLGM